MSKLIRAGECNHCGLCCKPPVIIEGPTIDRGEDRCKFYMDKFNNQKQGHCLIYGRGTKSIEITKDRYGNIITLSQIKWFNDNCIDYPAIEDIEAGYNKLPVECGFKFEMKII